MLLILSGEFILAVLNAYLVIQAYTKNEINWITYINVIFVVIFTLSLTSRVTNREI